MAAAAIAAGERGSVTEEEEALVLAWLMAQPDVAEAVDLALQGREEEAAPALVQALRGVLAVEGGEEGGAEEPGQVEPDGADKRGDEGADGRPSKRSRRGSAGPARCLCVVVCGIHGSGKSALCNILREVLGGTWLDYDELAFKQGQAGKAAVRQAFVAQLKATLTRSLAWADKDQNERAIFVDRRHTTQAHRQDVLHELKRLHWRRRGGRALLVEFSHSGDFFGYGADGQLSRQHCEQHLALCMERVEGRGEAHHTFRPSAKLRTAMRAAAKATETPSPEELKHFDKCVRLEVTRTPAESALLVIEELRAVGWLPSLRPAAELQPKADVAWQAYRRAESQWRQGAAVAAGEPEPPQEAVASAAAIRGSQVARQGKQRRQAAEAGNSPSQSPSPEPLAAEALGPPASSPLAPLGASAAQPGAQAALQTAQAARAATQAGLQPALQAPPAASAQAARQDAQQAAALQAGPDAALQGAAPETVQAALQADAPPATGRQWIVEVPEVSRVLTQKGILPTEFVPARRPHVVLTTKDESAPGLPQEQALDALQGHEVEVNMLEIVIEESVACAVVALPADLPCASGVPHVVLGAKAGITARYADDMLKDVKLLGKQRTTTSIPLPAPRPLRGNVSLESLSFPASADVATVLIA